LVYSGNEAKQYWNEISIGESFKKHFAVNKKMSILPKSEDIASIFVFKTNLYRFKT
jgi:hypothetical protein